MNRSNSKCECGGDKEFYDGALGYEAMICMTCKFHWNGQNAAEHAAQVAEFKELGDRRFSLVVAHTGESPLGESVPGNSAAFNMLTSWVSGPQIAEMKVGEGGHRRQATTADGRWLDRKKVVPIQYLVTRIS